MNQEWGLYALLDAEDNSLGCLHTNGGGTKLGEDELRIA
jgi:hypothetical protein